MIRQFHWLAILAITSMIGLTACRSNKVGTVQRRDNRGEMTYSADKRIGFTRSFKNVFYVESVNEKTNPDGILQVQVRIMNRTEEIQTLEYRFEWTDMDGMLVDTPASRWMIKNVKPGDSVYIKGVGPKPEAKDFYIKFQYKAKK